MREVSIPAPGVTRTFELHECLGRGGFGEVYRASMAMPSGVRTTVAVKVLKEGLDPFGQSIQRLRDEAHLLAALDHPAILRALDLVLLDDRVALVTEYVEGLDLSRLFKHPEPGFGARAMVEVVAEVAAALEAAWSREIDGRPMQLVHRDIKPGNIRLGRHGQVKLLDFGIARANIDREASTTTDTLLGTYQYMAPERFGGATGPSGDVFALGCLLYEGIMGRRFLNGLSLHQHYAALADPDNFEPLLEEQIAALPAHVPAGTRTLIQRALAFDPEARPTAGALAAACDAEAPFLRGVPLRTWAREREWQSGGRPGELTGRVIAEGPAVAGASPMASIPPYGAAAAMPPVDAASHEPVSVETVELTTSLRRRRKDPTPLWVWVSLLASIGVLGGAAAVLVAGVVVGSTLGFDAEATPTPVPPPAPSAIQPAAEPDPEPPPDPEPEPEPEPEPAVEPANPAPQAPTATARIEVVSPVPVTLQDAKGQRVPAQGAVEPGTYTLLADFGQGLERAGSGQLVASRVNTIRCRKLMRTCAIE